MILLMGFAAWDGTTVTNVLDHCYFLVPIYTAFSLSVFAKTET